MTTGSNVRDDTRDNLNIGVSQIEEHGMLTRLTGVSSAARNNVGVEVLFHTSNMGLRNLEFLTNVRKWDRLHF